MWCGDHCGAHPATGAVIGVDGGRSPVERVEQSGRQEHFEPSDLSDVSSRSHVVLLRVHHGNYFGWIKLLYQIFFVTIL